MDSINTLKPLGLSMPEETSKIGRRIEWMSKKQALFTIILFTICNISIIIFHILGPPYFISESISFDEKIDVTAMSRFSFDFTNLHYFNDFITLDICFNRSIFTNIPDSYNLSFMCHATMRLGVVMVDKVPSSSKDIEIHFGKDTNISDKVRLFALGNINFDTLHYLAMFKSLDGFSLPGQFEWHYADPAHSIVQVFLRMMFFIMTIIILIRLLLSDFNSKTSHITMRMMYYLDIILLFVCNPLYILSFFTDSPIFALVDGIMRIFLIVNVLYVALSVLLMSDLVHKDVSKTWLAVLYIPFFATFCLLASSSIYTVKQIYDDPLSKVNPIIKGFQITKFSIVGLYFLALVYGIITFKTDVPNEKPSYSIMAMVLLLSVVASSFYQVLDPYLRTDSAVQTYSFLAIGIFIYFFNFLNWPADSTDSGDPEAAAETTNPSILTNIVEDE